MTSFFHLFGQTINQLQIKEIEIPLIQRDYAQGRRGIKVERIRSNFLDAICTAAIPDSPAVGLDFIYGDVVINGEHQGKFYPLDGQQRLTTLFLLHWYAAMRAGVDIQAAAWTNFTYATRPGARTFCGRIVEHFPNYDDVSPHKLSDWLKDQSWYLYTWQHDPTIQSMLVMLDAIDSWFKQKNVLDFNIIWERLTDQQNPAIYFNLLPMSEHGLTADLYIKMNSRGKPLTEFENFKAHFETLLNNVDSNNVDSNYADAFSNKIDRDWSDYFWHYRGSDNIIDEEFMRFLRFITDVLAWLDNVPFTDETRTDDLADRVYGIHNQSATNHIEFMIKALDTWVQGNENETYINDQFEALFTATPVNAATPLLLFNTFNASKQEDLAKSPLDMFGACCQYYGEKGTAWTLSHTLLLYAVLLNRIHANRDNVGSFPKQLRILRNLIESSAGDEIKREDMPKLLLNVKSIIVDNAPPDTNVLSFNKMQIQNEIHKLGLLAAHPELQNILYKIEDHKLLRGCLAVFDLDHAITLQVFSQRVEAFYRLFDDGKCWPELTGALLAIGDYSRKNTRLSGYDIADFGAPQSEARWRDLFKGKLVENQHPTTDVLMNLLDQVQLNDSLTCLQTIQQDFVQHCDTIGEFDWRYYFVKYPAMREGTYGRYVINFTNHGYQACMLRTSVMRSYYRDPYLLAIMRKNAATTEIIEDPWFYGFETEPRRMLLKRSGIRIECVNQGWQLTDFPEDLTLRAAFDSVCQNNNIGIDGLYAVQQNSNGIDTTDRIELGGKLLKNLIDAGM